MDPATGTMGAAAISGLANLGGGFMSAQGASAANAANMAMNQQNLQFQNNVNAANWEHAQSMADYNWNHQVAQNQFNWDAMSWSAAQSAGQADLQRQWQERMSNTAYQRATADMRAAGINPMLAYMQGGASTPSGGQGSSSPASSGNTSGASSTSEAPQNKFAMGNTQEELGRAIGRAAASAVDTYRMGEDARLKGSQRDLTDEQTRKVGYETTLLNTQHGRGLAETDLIRRQEQTERERAEVERQKARLYASSARQAAAGASLDELRHREARPVNEGGHGRGTGIGPGTVDRFVRQLEDAVP